MNTLVVYESWFGNTKAVAEAVAAGLGTIAIPIAEAPAELPADLGLLVVGAPTHNMGLPGPKSRAEAAERGATLASGGVAEWLQGLRGTRAVQAAAFDTSTATFMGTAAKKAVKALKQAGFTVSAKPESFKVTDSGGPLADGELERATSWAAGLRTPGR